jgi:metal-dependent amidase/aminoacylase/carboxypeptidase family protein
VQPLLAALGTRLMQHPAVKAWAEPKRIPRLMFSRYTQGMYYHSHNDAALTALVAGAAVDLLGPSQVQWLEQPSLGAEDFAALLDGVRGTMFRLGVAGPQGCTPLHSCTFAPDEGALAVGVKVLTLSLLRWMGQCRPRA